MPDFHIVNLWNYGIGSMLLIDNTMHRLFDECVVFSFWEWTLSHASCFPGGY